MKKLFTIICVLFIAVAFGCTPITSDVKTEAIEYTTITPPDSVPAEFVEVDTNYRCIIDDNPLILPVFQNADDSCYYFYYRNNFTKITDINGTPLNFDTIDTYYSSEE